MKYWQGLLLFLCEVQTSTSNTHKKESPLVPGTVITIILYVYLKRESGNDGMVESENGRGIDVSVAVYFDYCP